jgi:hypothetical protein
MVMYRESHDGLLHTIDRLHRELGDLGTVRPRSYERTLWFVTAASVLCAVLGLSAASASRAHTREVEATLSQTRARLTVKASDLAQCLDLARESAGQETAR